MTTEKNAAEFQFKNGDKSLENFLQRELQESKIERLSNRVMLLTILFPVITGVILLIGYFDIKSRIDRTYNNKTASIEKISKDLENKFSFLSLEEAKINDIHSKTISSFEKSIAILQSDLKTTQSLLKKLDSSSVSREEMSQTIESLKGKNQELFDSIKAEIITLKDIVDLRAKDFEDVQNSLYKLTEIMSKMKDDLDKLRSYTSNLSEEKIGKKELDLALKLKEIGHRQELLKIKTTLDKEIDNLKKQTNNSQSSQTQTTAVETIKGSKQIK